MSLITDITTITFRIYLAIQFQQFPMCLAIDMIISAYKHLKHFLKCSKSKTMNLMFFFPPILLITLKLHSCWEAFKKVKEAALQTSIYAFASISQVVHEIQEYPWVLKLQKMSDGCLEINTFKFQPPGQLERLLNKVKVEKVL